jgi:ferrous iron transport protein A
MTLDQISLGQSAVVLRLNMDPGHSVPLMEMGLFEGVRVTLLSRAPLGDPLELQVGDYRLSLRLAQARGVEVAL